MERCYSCMQPLPDKKIHLCPHCGEPLKISYNTDMFLAPGSVLQGKFLVGKVLGSGGFGNTYIGWNKVLQCRVAIKEYFPKHLSSREKMRGEVSVSDSVSQQRFRAGLHQFLEEARSIATLHDVKGVVQVYTFFEENGTGYIIMEYLEGMTVKSIMEERGGKIDYEWSRRVMLTVLHTLREIHRRGILHRDIAPDNIFVTKDGVIKLIDFGAAKHATALANMHQDVILKAGYAPIEQYSKGAKQGPYTDLYAVAAMFYRLLTGTKPLPANERVSQDNLPSLSDLGIHIPEQAEMGIMVCLNVMPQYRLQNAQDFMEALDGRDFVPVYEPDWILPEVEERSGFMRKLQQLPLWKRAVLASGAVVAVILVAVGCVAAIAPFQRESRETVSISEEVLPQCEGKSLEDATRDLKKYGIRPNITYMYEPERRENTVVKMEPSAGTDAASVDHLDLTVESSTMVTIKKFNEEDDVKEICSFLKERCKEKYNDEMRSFNYHNKVKKNKCYGQSGSGNIVVKDLANFKVYISWGKKQDYQVSMPGLVGKSLEEAKKELKRRHLSMAVDVVRAIEDDAPEGTILSQDIPEGNQYNWNRKDTANYDVPEKVEVVVSKGFVPTPTPWVTPEPRRIPKPQKPNRAAKPKKTAKPKKKKKQQRDNHEEHFIGF